jgi:hypothetical protein
MNCSPSPGVRIISAMPCHLPSGKKPVSEMASARATPGWSQAQRRPIRPPQSCTTSSRSSRPRPARNRSSASTLRSQVPGRSGSDSPKPGRSGATARQPASASASIGRRHMNEDDGYPCTSSATGPSAGPATR